MLATLRAGFIGFVAAVALASVPGCTNSNAATSSIPDGGKDARALSEAGNHPSSASKAETLVTAPTSALVSLAQGDHQPTDDELALLSIFWLSFIHAQESGTIPDLWIETDLLSLVAGMAQEYPDFSRSPQTAARSNRSAGGSRRRALKDRPPGAAPTRATPRRR